MVHPKAVGHKIGGSQIYYVLPLAWLEECDAAQQTSEKASKEVIAASKKIKEEVRELQAEIHNYRGHSGKVCLMFQDEAGFGRINSLTISFCFAVMALPGINRKR